MPTYEYVCTACGKHFEKFQSITAAPIKTCPNCGKNKAQRQISGGAGFIFKGGGFYETDYRSEGYKKAAEADKAPAAVTSESTSSDAKPVETKAGDVAKSTETKVESKPATETKQAAATDTKPSKAKSRK